MIWYLLLAFPAAVLLLGVVARSGKVTATDTVCAVLDLQLDRQAELTREGSVAAQQQRVPQPRRTSRVAPRTVPALHSELLVG